MMMEQEGSGVCPHESEPGMLALQPAVLDRLLCEEPIQSHLNVDQRPFARGKFASVRKAWRTTSLPCGTPLLEQYAAKCQRKQRRGENVRHAILHEAAVLYLLRHEDGVVQLRGLYETPSEMILLLQLAPHGEVQRLLDESSAGVGEGLARACLHQTLSALRALHTRNIAHLDVKPQNLLLMAPPSGGCCEVKLCDFGIAREMRSNVELREVVGTPDYVAPEVLQYEPISLATDMWSMGILAYVLLSGHSPFAGDSKQETFLNITQADLDFPEDLFEDVSALAQDFVAALVQLQPGARLTVMEALNHPWITTGPIPASLTAPSSDAIFPVTGQKMVSENGTREDQRDAGNRIREKSRLIPEKNQLIPEKNQLDCVVGIPMKGRIKEESSSMSHLTNGITMSPSHGEPQVEKPTRVILMLNGAASTSEIVSQNNLRNEQLSRVSTTAVAELSRSEVSSSDAQGGSSVNTNLPSDDGGPAKIRSNDGVLEQSSPNIPNGIPSSSKPRPPPKPSNLNSARKVPMSKPPLARKPIMGEAKKVLEEQASSYDTKRASGSPSRPRVSSHSPSGSARRGTPPGCAVVNNSSPVALRRQNTSPSSPVIARKQQSSPSSSKRLSESPPSSRKMQHSSSPNTTRRSKASPVFPRKSQPPDNADSFVASSSPSRPSTKDELSLGNSRRARNVSPSPTRGSLNDSNTTTFRQSRNTTPSKAPATLTNSHVSRFSDSPTRHLARRLQQSPSRDCCAVPTAQSPQRRSLRTVSPSPTRVPGSPRSSRSVFSRNVDALHSGSPTVQSSPTRKTFFQLTKATSVPPQTDVPRLLGTTVDSSRQKTGRIAADAAIVSRKTPSQSPPLFQPAPKKSNTVSDFFSSRCSIQLKGLSVVGNGCLEEEMVGHGSRDSASLDLLDDRSGSEQCTSPSNRGRSARIATSQPQVSPNPRPSSRSSRLSRSPLSSHHSLSSSPSPPPPSHTSPHLTSPDTIVSRQSTSPNSKSSSSRNTFFNESSSAARPHPSAVSPVSKCDGSYLKDIQMLSSKGLSGGDMLSSKPVPKPRPAHLSIKLPQMGGIGFSCPPVTSCFAVFSSNSQSSPDNNNSFSSNSSSDSKHQQSGLVSPSSSMSSGSSEYGLSQLTARPLPPGTKTPVSVGVRTHYHHHRDKENDRNALNSPTESCGSGKETAWAERNKQNKWPAENLHTSRTAHHNSTTASSTGSSPRNTSSSSPPSIACPRTGRLQGNDSMDVEESVADENCSSEEEEEEQEGRLTSRC